MKSLAIAFVIVLASIAARAQNAAAPASTPASVPTIVFVNQDTLLANYNYFKAVQTKMQSLSQKAQTEIENKTQVFKKEVTDYQKNANNMRPAQQAATQKKLAKENENLQVLQQNTAKQLQEIEASENTTLYNKIADFFKTYAKAKGYKMVLTYSKTNPSMLYGDESLDVTKEVVAGLNDEYAKSGGK
jgi:outer membrane protein